jgi:glyoxylase-like metal-dependent hydrolase (beta-lactamase superfamily II)
MPKSTAPVAACLLVLAAVSSAQQPSPRKPAPPAAPKPVAAPASVPAADVIKAASDALGASVLKTLRFTGFGANYSVGQSPSPAEPWPRVSIKTYEALINYDTPAMQIDLTREQGPVPPRGGGQPFVGEQRQLQMVSGTVAWNIPSPPPAPTGRGAGEPPAAQEGEGRGSGRGSGNQGPPPQPAPGAVAERLQTLWSTPHGFLKAAAANTATAVRVGGGTQVTFTANGRKYVGSINASNFVEKVQTWVDNPVLGDMLVETTYSNYQKFDPGVSFPMRIVQTTGGFPSLDLWISAVGPNFAFTLDVPETVKTAPPPGPANVDVQKVANGIYWLTGGSHHSVAVEMRDHVIVIEGPLNEERALAVIAQVKATIPNKPIRFVVNTHHHFDHSGGLRPFVDEGATIVTHQLNRAFYETAWAAPRTIAPDLLSRSRKAPVFQTVTDRAVLTDGARSLEVHRIANNPHNDGFLMVYLPAEKILVEADAYTPAAAPAQPPANGTPAAPARPSPTTINLLQNVERLKLDVAQIAPLHGPRLASLQELVTAAGGQSTR